VRTKLFGIVYCKYVHLTDCMIETTIVPLPINIKASIVNA